MVFLFGVISLIYFNGDHFFKTLFICFFVQAFLWESIVNRLRAVLGMDPLPASLKSVTLSELKGRHDAAIRRNADNIQTSLDELQIGRRAIEFLNGVLAGTRPKPGLIEFEVWIKKPDVPSGVKEFGNHVYQQFKSRSDEILVGERDREFKNIRAVEAAAEAVRKKQQVEEKKQLAEARKRAMSAFLSANEDKVQRFLEIAYRKVSLKDEYGDENWNALNEEIIRFLKKLNQYTERRNPWEAPCDLTVILRKKFTDYHQAQNLRASVIEMADVKGMTGEEFEQYIISMLIGCGVVDARATIATGDQGADVLFSFNRIKVVIQAKRYSSSVGNKAVQEVYSAKAFYHCDQAWVVTNSTFTGSAKTLARQLGVHLLDGSDLLRFSSKFNEFLSDSNAA